MFKKFPAFMLSAALLWLPVSHAQAKTMMPEAVQNQLIVLSDGPPTSGDACVIKSLFPAFYGKIPGVPGTVAIGLVDNDPENCGGEAMAQPALRAIAARQAGDNKPYQKIQLPAQLQPISGLMIQKILSVKPENGGFWITVLHFGVNDPSCCASQKAKFWIKIQS